LQPDDLYWLERRFEIAANDTLKDAGNRMSTRDLITAVMAKIPGKATVHSDPSGNGDQIVTIGDKTVKFSPMASNAEIVAALQNPFVPTANTKVHVSAIDRLKEKALKARSIAPNAIKAFESDLDGLIAQEQEIEAKRVAAVSPHHEAIAGVKGELDGLKSAIDILSNGGPQ
jgi:hypothetical protein